MIVVSLAHICSKLCLLTYLQNNYVTRQYNFSTNSFLLKVFCIIHYSFSWSNISVSISIYQYTSLIYHLRTPDVNDLTDYFVTEQLFRPDTSCSKIEIRNKNQKTLGTQSLHIDFIWLLVAYWKHRLRLCINLNHLHISGATYEYVWRSYCCVAESLITFCEQRLFLSPLPL
jgi:hypothetical protein